MSVSGLIMVTVSPFERPSSVFCKSFTQSCSLILYLHWLEELLWFVNQFTNSLDEVHLKYRILVICCSCIYCYSLREVRRFSEAAFCCLIRDTTIIYSRKWFLIVYSQPSWFILPLLSGSIFQQLLCFGVGHCKLLYAFVRIDTNLSTQLPCISWK